MRIKVCGITSVADAEAAADAGVDAVGLNFFARSPRYVSLEQARRICAELPPFVEPVGLFVATTAQSARAALAQLSLMRTVQLHETPWEPMPARWIAAFGVKDRASLGQIAEFVARHRLIGQLPAGVLVDACVPGRHGGTGVNAPWELLSGFDAGVPLMLAGGLTPENLPEAIRLVRPYAVDVASGVESSPGVKDHEKLRRFVAVAREAASRFCLDR